MHTHSESTRFTRGDGAMALQARKDVILSSRYRLPAAPAGRFATALLPPFPLIVTGPQLPAQLLFLPFFFSVLTRECLTVDIVELHHVTVSSQKVMARETTRTSIYRLDMRR